MVIELTPEQQRLVETQAKQRGYPNVRDYVLALVEADVDIRAELKEGLRQAMHGETVPLKSLWTDDMG